MCSSLVLRTPPIRFPHQLNRPQKWPPSRCAPVRISPPPDEVHLGSSSSPSSSPTTANLSLPFTSDIVGDRSSLAFRLSVFLSRQYSPPFAPSYGLHDRHRHLVETRLGDDLSPSFFLKPSVFCNSFPSLSRDFCPLALPVRSSLPFPGRQL